MPFEAMGVMRIGERTRMGGWVGMADAREGFLPMAQGDLAPENERKLRTYLGSPLYFYQRSVDELEGNFDLTRNERCS